MWNTLSLSLLPNSLGPGVVVPVKIPSMDQIELFNNLIYLESLKRVQTNDRYLTELILAGNV